MVKMAKSKPKLFVVSLQNGKSPTGVEKHFNQIIEFANAQGVHAELINPHESNFFTRKLTSAIRKLLEFFNLEYATLWSRWTSYYLLKKNLIRELSGIPGQQITLYAQEPLSARAAIDVRKHLPCRVVAVVHYNISEAYEYELTGITQPNGRLFCSLLRNESDTLPKVDELLFVSRFMMNQVTARCPDIERVTKQVIHNFSFPLNVHQSSGLKGDIIAIGTLEPRKNQGFILDVLAAAHQRGYFYRLTLVGSGHNLDLLHQQASRLGIQDYVHFAGFIPNAATEIKSHRVLVHAALMESLCITLIEALAVGRPILAAPVGGIPEIFSHGVEGFYWKLDDPIGAADMLIEVLENETLYQQMSKAALQRYELNFTSEKLAPKWLNAIVPGNTDSFFRNDGKQ